MAGTQEHSAEHSEHHGAHSRFLAHHFDSQAQQFDAGKLGMWLFLVQEILFFSGLFCAYAIYRSNHPEIFVYADHFLDRRLGAINTGVLILSSFTIAWAVRCAQLNQRKLMVGLLGITFACAGMFLCIKYFEYEHKWKDGLLWGHHYKPVAEHTVGESETPAAKAHQVISQVTGSPGSQETHPSAEAKGPESMEAPKNVHIFFGIYFAMTGLHAIHILIGMGVIIWMMIRGQRGDFSKEYFGPIEYTALYWHLVDLVWIYLFPLLYLIH